MLGLALLTIAVYWPATGYDFIALDDLGYVTQNERILTGLTGQNIRWAFTTVHENWWLPILWLSYMLDAELFGPGAFGFHLTNILLHAANVLLLYGLLFRMTRAHWRCALVAALFALHPLRLESVIWVTERKDVLSAFFGFLCVGAYLRHLERPTWGRYWMVPLLLLLGLMSKVILIALPIGLLLLDYWPLQQAGLPWEQGQWKRWMRLILQKTPLLLLAVVFALINLKTHASGVEWYMNTPWPDRFGLVFPNYWTYLAKVIWPSGMALLYPERDVVNPLALVLSLLGLGIITGWVLWQIKRRPYLAVGWLWFLLWLFPVIRGVRLGLAAYADRFTYLPAIGLFIMLVWGVGELAISFRWWKPFLATASLCLLLGYTYMTRHHMTYWKSSEALFRRTLEVTQDNWLIHLCLGAVMMEQNRFDEELECLMESYRINPTTPLVNAALGVAWWRKGNMDLAEKHYRLASQHESTEWNVHARIGIYLAETKRYELAMHHFRRALETNPGHYETIYNLGNALLYAGRPTEALPYLQRTFEYAQMKDLAHFKAGQAWLALGKDQEAVLQFREALALAPDVSASLNNLAWVLASTSNDTLRNPEEALMLALKAATLTQRKNADILDTLSVSYAANGDYSNALAACEEAMVLAAAQTNNTLLGELRNRRDRLGSGKPSQDSQ